MTAEQTREALVAAGNSLADVRDLLIVVQLALMPDGNRPFAAEECSALLHVVNLARTQADRAWTEANGVLN